jgi:hypothetical protein
VNELYSKASKGDCTKKLELLGKIELLIKEKCSEGYYLLRAMGKEIEEIRDILEENGFKVRYNKSIFCPKEACYDCGFCGYYIDWW